jgi:hypothetical protein
MKKTFLTGVTLFALFCASNNADARVNKSDVVFHFATVGDCRGEPSSPNASAQEKLWVQNTGVLARMIREMQMAKPQALFFNGDMIYGYSSDQATMERYYAYWRGMMANLMESGTYVVPIPGNHEVQIKVKHEDGQVKKTAIVENENVWRANMGDLIFNPDRWQSLTHKMATGWNIENAPAIGTDGITTDQRQLSYSFDVGKSHFAMINTDPAGFDSSAPVAWLASDLNAAKKRGAKKFFIFGHKMAFTYATEKQKATNTLTSDGFDARPEVRDAFWNLVEAYHAIYFTGHQHTYHAEQPRKNQGGTAWQVIIGSGGSPFSIPKEYCDKASDRIFAWADVTIHANGEVAVKIVGFDEAFGPTRVIEKWVIAP